MEQIKNRYSWKQMPEDYEANYFNYEDYKKGKKFIVIDNNTGKEYEFPRVSFLEKRSKPGYDILNYVIFDKNDIPYGLRNDVFIIWAICTTKDFYIYFRECFVEVLRVYLDDELKNCDQLELKNNINFRMEQEDLAYKKIIPELYGAIIDNFDFPEIFSNKIIDGKGVVRGLNDADMTEELCNRAFRRNNNVIYFMPKEKITNEMIASLGNIKNLEPKLFGTYNSLEFNLLTPELFEKIYFNCDEEHKLKWFSLAGRGNFKFNQGIEQFITQKIATDILSINIRTIWYIPTQFISKENAIKAMEEDILLIEYVPSEYQTIDYQKRLIDKNAKSISLIDETILTDEIIYYALRKSGLALGGIPKERRTIEMCEYAINFNGNALRHVPGKIKTYQMCYDAVVKDSNMIKYVPVELLTQDFVNELNSAQVVIPLMYQGYVRECLEANNKLYGDSINPNAQPFTEMRIDKNADYLKIRLDTMQEFFSESTLKKLIRNGIMTVGDLFDKSENKEFRSLILRDSVKNYREIFSAIKLLKCKYLGIDPLIDFDEEKTMNELSAEFGFSTRVANCLRRSGYTPKDLYELLQDDLCEKKLLKIRNMGETGAREILSKTSIVLEYNNEHKKKEESLSDDETLEELNDELASVRAEIQRLTVRTDEILAKIQEKIQEKTKGGVLK